MDNDIEIFNCDSRRIPLADGVVQTCVTSPPYYGLRDYGTAKWEGGDTACDHKLATDNTKSAQSSSLGGSKRNCGNALSGYTAVCGKCGAVRIDSQIGLEQTPSAYVANIVQVMREVWRVLRDDGTLWLNLGDSYAGGGNLSNGGSDKQRSNKGANNIARDIVWGNLKTKDLIGIPWRVAFALQQPYEVPGCVKSEVDRSWLAAMFDGEGCIGIRRFSSYRKEVDQQYQDGFVVYTTVGNNDTELLDHCVQLTGYGSVHIKQKAGDTDSRGIVSRRDNFVWRLDGNKAVDVISSIYPYLIAKRRQACLAYTLDKLNKNGHGSRAVPQEIQEKKAYLKELVCRCNQREQVDIPSWVEEPKPEVRPGWYLRSDIIWHKPNPMPESVTDRPTKAHEYIFLLSKQARYYYDAEAVTEDAIGGITGGFGKNYDGARKLAMSGGEPSNVKGKSWSERNRRTVWTVTTSPYKGAHFATYPPKLIEPCILAGSKAGDIVLDPFCGSGTTGAVALEHGRRFVGVELNPEYIELAKKRLAEVQIRMMIRHANHNGGV